MENSIVFNKILVRMIEICFFCKSKMVETDRRYEIVEGRLELQVELACTNPDCGNVSIRRFPTEKL